MYITLDAPIKMETLNWQKSEIAGLLPLPKSTVGKVSTDKPDSCNIYVGETSLEDFNAYADECSEYGFFVAYERGEKYYNAKDESGNKLSLSYNGNNVMNIQIKKFDEVETSDDKQQFTEVKQETESTKKSSDNNILTYGMRPEFKKAMDSYESFMNEYCEFMKKYEKSDGTDMSLWSDYASYLSKYSDMVKDFEAWDDGEMNTAETAYYLDVQTRVNKKLLEVSQ